MFVSFHSPEDRREYLESLLRECKKEEAAPVLDDEGLNYILARRYLKFMLKIIKVSPLHLVYLWTSGK